MKTVSLQTRLPKDMKDAAGKILQRLGLDFSAANRMFYAQIIETKGIPFVSKLPIAAHDVSRQVTGEEEREWDRQVSQASLEKLWGSPEDDIWDEILPKLPSIQNL